MRPCLNTGASRGINMRDGQPILSKILTSMISGVESTSPQECNKHIEAIKFFSDELLSNPGYIKEAAAIDLFSMMDDLGNWGKKGSFAIKNPCGEIFLNKETQITENDRVKNNRFPQANPEQRAAVRAFCDFVLENIPNGILIILSQASGLRAGHIRSSLINPENNNLGQMISLRAVENKNTALDLLCIEALRSLPEDVILKGRDFSEKSLEVIEIVLPKEVLQKRGSASIRRSYAQNDLSI